VSDVRSVPVGCSRFSRRGHLISVLCSSLYEGSLGPGVDRSRLNSAVELSCSVQTLSARFLYAAAFMSSGYCATVRTLLHRPTAGAVVPLACATAARFLAVFPPRAESFRPQQRKSLVFPKGSQNVVRSLHQQRPQILISLFADARLWFAFGRISPPRLQPNETSRVTTFPEAMRVLDGQHIGRGDQVAYTLYLFEQRPRLA
jgi:hypothetical protein